MIDKIVCIDTVHNAIVELMTISGNYAMVRRKGCFPYIRTIKELKFANDEWIRSHKEMTVNHDQ